MSLDSYANLKTELADWANKGNITTQIDTFIDLAEADINRFLRTQDMEAVATSTVSSNPIDLSASPFTRFQKMKALMIVSASVDRPLNYISPDLYNSQYSATSSGIPEFYTIVGSNLYLDPAPSTSYSYTATYYSGINPLSGSNTTNWVLINHPDLYLYGALKHARIYLRKQDIEGYEAAFNQALALVKREDIRNRGGGTARRISEMGAV